MGGLAILSFRAFNPLYSPNAIRAAQAIPPTTAPAIMPGTGTFFEGPLVIVYECQRCKSRINCTVVAETVMVFVYGDAEGVYVRAVAGT